MTAPEPDAIHVREDGNMCMVGPRACAVYLSVSWPTGDPMPDWLRALLTNPNYGPGAHPF